MVCVCVCTCKDDLEMHFASMYDDVSRLSVWCVCVCVCVYVQGGSLSAFCLDAECGSAMHAYIYIYIYIYMYVCMYVYTQSNIDVCINVCMHRICRLQGGPQGPPLNKKLFNLWLLQVFDCRYSIYIYIYIYTYIYIYIYIHIVP